MSVTHRPTSIRELRKKEQEAAELAARMDEMDELALDHDYRLLLIETNATSLKGDEAIDL